MTNVDFIKEELKKSELFNEVHVRHDSIASFTLNEMYELEKLYQVISGIVFHEIREKVHKVEAGESDTRTIPCPFCGCNVLDIAPKNPFYVQLRCKKCHAYGPAESNLDTAIEAWNGRDVETSLQGIYLNG